MAHTLFWILIIIIVADFLFGSVLSQLNASWYGKKLPEEVQDVFERSEYEKSQRYKAENHRFGRIQGSLSIAATLAFFMLDGFAYTDALVRSWSSNEIVVSLLFFGVLGFASSLLSLPFSYYHTFVIEEKYGFNKSSKKLFWTDAIKGALLATVLGAILLGAILYFYQLTGSDFWIWAWVIISGFSILLNMFYSTLIVPLFNKQTPLEEGELRDAIQKMCTEAGFVLKNVFVIDGSKRSSKANAYFAGLGSKKRIVLYDTLINDLSTEEIVAVLAHEIGHYKHKHTLSNMLFGVINTGVLLYVFSLFVNESLLAEALNVPQQSFHIALVVFSLLYSPIEQVVGISINMLSRKFEYQADNFAKRYNNPEALITALKKLSGKSLSNLTPHPAYEFVYYSHPSLVKRIKNLRN